MPHPWKLALLAALPAGAALAATDPIEASFRRDVAPLLEKYCYDCHGYGKDKGGIEFDALTTPAELHDTALWSRALRNVRTGLMPPADEGPLPAADAEKIMAWIKREALALDPARPDPGRVTLRRLNRVEYRNTVRDLVGVDYDTQKEFPADDTGHGFDNIGSVLTLSPMLLEKYLDAAQAIVAQTVPTQPRVVASNFVPGRRFAPLPAPADVAVTTPPPTVAGEALDFSYYTAATARAPHYVEHPGHYELGLELRTFERYVEDVFDLNRCRVVFKCDGETLLDQEFMREGGKTLVYSFPREWQPGEHTFTLEVQPLAPARPQVRQLRLRLSGLTVRGPLEEKFWVPPAGYAKIFPRPVPADAPGRRAYARELLEPFATRAFRHPLDPVTLERLQDLAEGIYAQPKNTFESGIAQAMVAVLASPSFLFREENVEPLRAGQAHPFVNEYALASRLSYFLWSSLPDEELFRLARTRQLRAQLPAQVRRMLADRRANEFVRNFTGQWLQARDIATVQVNPLEIALRDRPNPEFEAARETGRRLERKRNRTPEDNAALERARAAVQAFDRAPRAALTENIRRAMGLETELTFAHVLRADRSLLELIESDYTFLNEDLAKHYGIAGVTGSQMRKVALPPGNPRGGVLTEGTVLSVTSNPTRTSPVKRGVFILTALLGTPPPPPPPNIPALEDAAPAAALKTLGLRDTLALHAKNPACAACHQRMDPLGLALENFNAHGVWRDTELNQPIQPAGRLITGESFANVQELKHVLVTQRRRDFYYCFTEKLLTYALGRGLEPADVVTVDALVAQLEAADGKPSALLHGIVNSAPFQQRRRAEPASLAATPAP